MKAKLKGISGIELNCDYLRSVGGMFTYFYIPDSAVNADLLNAVCVDGPISGISKSGDEWQVQVRTEMIEWED